MDVYWNCNFPTCPHVRHLVWRFEGHYFLKEQEVTLSCFYRSSSIIDYLCSIHFQQGAFNHWAAPPPHTNIFAPSLTLYLNVHSNYEISLSLSLSISLSISLSLSLSLFLSLSFSLYLSLCRTVGWSIRRSVSSVCHRDYSQR